MTYKINTAYLHPSGVQIHVKTTDAVNIKADVAIIGKSPCLLKEIERLTKQTFSVFERNSEFCRWKMLTLKSSNFLWQNVFSLQFSSRIAKADSIHVWRLCTNMVSVVFNLYTIFKPKKIVILPFSWRNPDITALITIKSIQSLADHISSLLQLSKLDRFINKIEDSAIRKIIKNNVIEEAIYSKEKSEEQFYLRTLAKNIVRPVFYLPDKFDPSPYIDVLEEKSDALKIYEKKWGSCKIPFVRIFK